MKKVWISILSILLMTSFLSACGEKKEDAGEEKIKIVTTIFPEYDWVRNIVGAENETIEVDRWSTAVPICTAFSRRRKIS